MSKILVATTNKGKIMEFSKLLQNLMPEVQILSLSDFIAPNPPKETGETFEENAKIKADFYFNHFKIPVIVEDSGFCVKSLNNMPGIHSAKWGENGDFTKGIKKLYKMLNGSPSKCHFISVIIFKTNEKEIIAKGRIEGETPKEPRGENGFGFDPAFIPNGFEKTFAEMTIEEKSSISHRKLAICNLIAKL